MKLGDAVLLFIVAIMVSILWISMGYGWGCVAFMWVAGTGLNLLHARAEEYKKRMDVLKRIAKLNSMVQQPEKEKDGTDTRREQS